MAEYVTKEQVIDWFRPYGHLDKPIPFETLVSDLRGMKAADVEPVRRGRWERCGGDLHSSGYAIYCSICNKTHFVNYKYSLGGLYGCKELFEKPKYCPSCGAFMEFEE